MAIRRNGYQTETPVPLTILLKGFPLFQQTPSSRVSFILANYMQYVSPLRARLGRFFLLDTLFKNPIQKFSSFKALEIYIRRTSTRTRKHKYVFLDMQTCTLFKFVTNVGHIFHGGVSQIERLEDLHTFQTYFLSLGKPHFQ